MSFKDNLKAELEYQDIQLKELAKKTGISKNTLGNYLTGHNSLPNADSAVKIAKALNVSVEYLVTGKEDSVDKGIKENAAELIKEINYLSDNDIQLIAQMVKRLKK